MSPVSEMIGYEATAEPTPLFEQSRTQLEVSLAHHQQTIQYADSVIADMREMKRTANVHIKRILGALAQREEQEKAS